MTRRELAKITLGGALVNGSRLPATVRPQPPGIKLGSLAPAEPTDEDIAFSDNLELTSFIALSRQPSILLRASSELRRPTPMLAYESTMSAI